ncbi:uncharacterized protein LOC129729444 [Wyeomyia smithii]|uniref:uncharacterized protein LOC129729444 n=1 Tax=Wyeomyia smithii TaxID=174621 RepID=UPI0024680B34|nr:uncharacterized protein LOC129729444 [Wyeomyia smithii]
MLKLIWLGGLFFSCSAAPFINWKIDGANNNGGTTILNKLQNIGEKVYENKRNFLNGINEKVSNLLWIPPLSSTTETIPTTTIKLPVEVHQQAPLQEDDRLIFSNDNDSDENYTLNLAIYARSSFLSPDDFNPEKSLAAIGPSLTKTVNNNIGLIRENLP